MRNFTTQMLLKNLIKRSPQNLKKLKIKGLALNSNEVKKGFIFFAIKGNNSNGENYIHQAIKKGAILIICSKRCIIKNKINVIKTNYVKRYLVEITTNFYKVKPKNIFAVTGTNGKTSVADFFYQILDANNIPVASIGTLGIKHKGNLFQTNLTSPDIITLHRNLEKLKKKNIDNVIIEASSHGLEQKRLNGIEFKAGVFTNFSQDHLDYHKTMKSYLNSKLILFSKLLKKNSYVITDKFIKQFPILKKISKQRKLKLIDITSKMDQIKKIKIPLVGSFQIKNLSMAILAAELCGLNELKINKVLSSLKNVNGRLELIKEYPNNIRVFIDYAHTPEAMREVIKSVKKHYNNSISLVFGCGGNRDLKKRPLMAKIAKNFCKKIYVTDDNPRKENPKKIRQDIIKHLKGSNYFEIGNRSEAVRKAILKSKPNETIIIMGKGHETIQNYGDNIFSVSDKQIVKNLKVKKQNFNSKKQNFHFNCTILNKIIKNRKFKKISGVAIDTRDLKKNNLFLTIKGKNNDGTSFISKALKKGASYIVSSKKNIRFTKKLIKVDNTYLFLNKFAELKRKNCNTKILAVTGSAGKTSLKNMLSFLLSKCGNTYASPRSFNNHYGVPLSLSNLSQNHQFGVFEIGMSKAGEIDKLSKLVKPDIAIITNIAEAHIENFSNIKGIAKSKSEIIRNITKEGTLILNRDDKFFNYLRNKAKLKKLKVVSFGTAFDSDIRLIKIENYNQIKKIIVQVKNKIFRINVGNTNVNNVLASLSVLNELNLDLNQMIINFKRLQPSEGRGKIYEAKRYNKRFKLIDESYNANPLSVKNAINSLSSIKKIKFKKYLILGDMLELGKKSAFYHKELSKLINNSDIDKVFVKGEKSLFTYKYLRKEKRGNILQSNQDVDLILKNIISNNDYLMIKGSNATGLNIISKSMRKGI